MCGSFLHCRPAPSLSHQLLHFLCSETLFEGHGICCRFRVFCCTWSHYRIEREGILALFRKQPERARVASIFCFPVNASRISVPVTKRSAFALAHLHDIEHFTRQMSCYKNKLHRICSKSVTTKRDCSPTIAAGIFPKKNRSDFISVRFQMMRTCCFFPRTLSHRHGSVSFSFSIFPLR